MVAKWKPLRSNSAGAVPTTGQLDEGQLAVNTADQMMYTKMSGVVVRLMKTMDDMWSYIQTKILPVSAGGTGAASLSSGALLFGNGTSAVSTMLPSSVDYVVKASVVSGTLTWIQDYASSYWLDGINTATPNGTVSVQWLTPRGSATNIDAAIIPKGNGAFIAQIPDGTLTGGNKRGMYAFDISRARSTNTQVASGAYASILGGFGNTASGDYSAVVNGNLNVANGRMSCVLAGMNISTRNIEGAVAFGTTSNASLGMTQCVMYTLGGDSSGTTPVRMTTNKGASTATNQIILDNNSAVYFTGQILAFDTTNADYATANWSISGSLKRAATASTVAMIGTTSITQILSEFGISLTLGIAAAADTTLGGLSITATGITGRSIRWVGLFRTVEIMR